MGDYPLITVEACDCMGGFGGLPAVAGLREIIEEAGLVFSVVESLPVSEEIKLGLPERERHIENYCRSLRALGEDGVEVVCYNFMPVFDWTRTDLARPGGDGSSSLGYEPGDLTRVDPRKGFSLPGLWEGLS